MNIPLLAHLIALRVPELAKDSQFNNEVLLVNMIREEYERPNVSPPIITDTTATSFGASVTLFSWNQDK